MFGSRVIVLCLFVLPCRYHAEGAIVADGKQDTACNYVGGYRVATESLAWAGATAFKEAPLRPLLIGGAETGLFKTVGLLTWVEVEAAGHMVTQLHVHTRKPLQ